MITKPREHDINRAGKRLLREVLEHLGWVLTEVTEDYGIDYNVQVFDKERESPTGASFHVQLKSSESSEYSTSGDFISQDLSIDHARHYSSEMRSPVIVVHADVIRKKVYWYAPQLDCELIARLKKSEQQSVTVRIPTAHDLPATAPELLNTLNKVYLLLGSRELSSAPTVAFAESLKRFPDQEALRRGLQEKNDAVKLQRIVELYRGKKFIDARVRANSILNDPDSSVEVKFWSEIQVEALDFHESVHSGRPQSEHPKIFLAHARALRILTRSGPCHLKFFALIAAKAAELDALVHENSGLFMALQQHIQRGGAPMIVLDVYARRTANTKRLVAKYNQCVRLARYATNYPNRWVLPRALARIVNAVGIYASTLRWERSFEAERALAASTLQICKLAAWIAQETGDSEALVLSIISALMTTDSDVSEAYLWAKQTALALPDPEFRDDALARIDRARRRWRGERVEGDYHGNVHVQIAQNIAASLGLDPNDENDPLIKGLMIAARDNSPERVLAKCEHLLVSQGAIGPVARQIQFLFSLGTAGSKVVHCTLHNFHMEGRELDLAYEPFKNLHCDSCPDKKPRPEDWRYTDAIRQEIESRNAECVARLAGTEHGVRFTGKD